MARHVFFSFDYEHDIFRVNVVRNNGLTKKGIADAGFFDDSLWEKSRKEGDAAIKRMIDNGLKGTTVTCVLVGSQTASRPWVKYELEKSIEMGSGLLAVRIDNIKGQDGKAVAAGANPLDSMMIGSKRASSVYSTYDWVLNDGYNNFGTWVEAAAKKAGR